MQQLQEKDYQKTAWEFLQEHYFLSESKKKYAEQISLLFRPQLNNFQELIGLSDYFFQKPAYIALSEKNETLLRFIKSVSEINK